MPYALIDNGLRRYVRGYDRARECFADFVANRIDAPQLMGDEIPEAQAKAAEFQWNRIVEIHIVPHSRLKCPETIDAECAKADCMLKVQVRAAVAGYVLRRWNVDYSSNHSLGEPEIHLWLNNQSILYGVDNLAIAPGYLP